MSSLDQLPRLLALVPWLLAHPGSRVSDVAAEFGVSERQLRADLNLVWMCGLPGHGPGDLMDVVYEGDRVRLENADTIARPLRLSADEALALIAALRTLVGLAGAGEQGAVQRALAKLETAAGQGAEAAGRVAVDVEAERDVLAAVRDALERGRRLHLRYYVPGRDETTERDVDPVRVLVTGGRTYLQGWCRLVEDVRTFRLDRVFAVQVLDVAAEIPDEAHGLEVGDALFTPSAEHLQATLELTPAAAWVSDYYPCETDAELPGGGRRVTLRARDTAWAVRLALGLAGTGHVVAPDDVVDAVRMAAQAALDQYRAP